MTLYRARFDYLTREKKKKIMLRLAKKYHRVVKNKFAFYVYLELITYVYISISGAMSYEMQRQTNRQTDGQTDRQGSV